MRRSSVLFAAVAGLCGASSAHGAPTASTAAPAHAQIATKPVASSAPKAPAAPASAGKGVVAAKPPAKPAPKKIAAAGGWVPPAYLAMVKKWHEPTGAPKADVVGRPKLVLWSINRSERVELEARADFGGFGPQEMDKASWILRSADGSQHPVDPRVLEVAYALQRHFGAAEVRFLSGYRAPKRPGSNHGYGRAIDLVIPGATDDEVATFARSLGFTGVGIYPTSGFVHVDVRDRSFFWVDRSGPGKANKTVGILGGDAAASDGKARKSGLLGTPTAKIGRDVDAALAARAKAVASAAPVVDDGESPYDDDDH